MNGIIMKRKGLLIIFAAALLIFNACSESTNPSGTAKVGIRGTLTKNTISSSLKQNTSINEVTVESITVSRIRILIRDLKIKVNGEDCKIEDDDDFDSSIYKYGPFVIDAKYPISQNFIDTILPIGKVNDIEFEIYRLDDSKLSIYAAQPTFAPFATSERYSIIINGKLTVAGIETDFTYYSKVEGNIHLEYEDEPEIESDRNAVIKIAIDPTYIFKNGNLILDPRASENSSYIDNRIKAALHSEFED